MRLGLAPERRADIVRSEAMEWRRSGACPHFVSRLDFRPRMAAVSAQRMSHVPQKT